MTPSTGDDPFDPFEDQPTPTGPDAAVPAPDLPDLDVEGSIVALADALNDALHQSHQAAYHMGAPANAALNWHEALARFVPRVDEHRTRAGKPGATRAVSTPPTAATLAE